MPPIGPGVAHVRHVAEDEVIDHTQCIGWALDNHWPFAKVERGHDVNTLGIRREKQRVGIHQILGADNNAIARHPNIAESFAYGVNRCTGHCVQEYLNPTHKVEVAVDEFDGLFSRETINKFKRADAGFDTVGRHDRCRNVGRHGKFCIRGLDLRDFIHQYDLIRLPCLIEPGL